jgi:hypothetical protein
MKIARRLRKESTMTLEWIASRLGMGTRTYLAHMIYWDGKTKPKNDAPAPIVGTQDDDYVYGAAFDALNIFELTVQWNSRPTASLILAAQLPVS